MSCKVKGSSVPGYWGGDISKRVDAEKIPDKILTLLYDKILTRGKDVYLWRQVDSAMPGTIYCSCNKDTTKRPDITCASCYGTKTIPGYDKFAHQTLFVSSISPGLTFTNTILNTSIKPHRILLVDNLLTGTVVSAPIAYTNLDEYDWDYRVDAPNIKDTNTVVVEFSINGTTYNPIANINNTGIKPIGVGNIYIRITMSRVAAADRSPEFEIIRIRHPNVLKPYIKILRPQVTELPTWMVYGQRMENMAERFWTMPLNLFDESITPNTSAARIEENSFYARISGINAGNKFITTKLTYNEEFNIFTHQSFEVRRTQAEEFYSKLVF